MTVRVEPAYFTAALLNQGFPRNWVAVVIDRRGVILARTHSPQTYVGQTAVPELLAASSKSERGRYEVVIKEGERMSAAFVKSPLSGWSTAVGVPKHELQAPVLRSVGYVAVLGSFTLAAAVLLSVGMSRRLSRQITSAADAACAVGKGLEPVPQNSGVRELEALSRALVATSKTLRERHDRISADLRAMTVLHSVANVCARPDFEFAAFFDTVVEAAIAIAGADKGNVQLLDPVSGALKIAAQRGFDEPFLKFFAEVRDEPSACGMAVQSGGRVIVEDVTQSEIFAGQPALNMLLDAGVRAVQSTPLMSTAGTAVLGMISTHFSKPHRPNERELRLMDLLARSVADSLERSRAAQEIAALTHRLRATVDTVVDAVIVIDESGTIQSFNPAAERIFGYKTWEVVGKNVSMLMPEPHRTAHDGYITAYLRTGVAKILGIGREVEGQRKDGTTLSVDLAVAEWRVGEKRFFTGVIRDITRRKQAEERVRTIMRELSHRTKNVLAVVQAIAWQTARKSIDPEAFAESFGTRIDALARSHDLLAKRQWEGVSVEELVHGQLHPFVDDPKRLITQGPDDLVLTPDAAQALGLALHELATNTVKYGALSAPTGWIELVWMVDSDRPTPPTFRMSWREISGPKISSPPRFGFGYSVLKSMMAHLGEVTIDFPPQGLTWDFTAAADGVLLKTPSRAAGSAVRRLRL